MKHLAIIVLVVLGSSFIPATTSVLKFDDVKYNFGFIHQGEIVVHEFTFTNSGEEPVTILDAEVSCKCTSVEFPKQPIAKGQSGSIKVIYDSKSAIDRQERTVLVISNASNSPVTLTFKCVVLKPRN